MELISILFLIISVIIFVALAVMIVFNCLLCRKTVERGREIELLTHTFSLENLQLLQISNEYRLQLDEQQVAFEHEIVLLEEEYDKILTMYKDDKIFYEESYQEITSVLEEKKILLENAYDRIYDFEIEVTDSEVYKSNIESVDVLYDKYKRILIVGDGNFSFTEGLLGSFVLSPGKLITSNFDKLTTLISKYGKDIEERVQKILMNGATVMFEIDATNLHLQFAAKSFNLIIFNFPHIGGSDAQKNIKFLTKFFTSAKVCLMNNGEIHLSLIDRKFYNDWDIPNIARATGYTCDVEKFYPDLYKSYQHVTTVGCKSPGISKSKIYKMKLISCKKTRSTNNKKSRERTRIREHTNDREVIWCKKCKSNIPEKNWDVHCKKIHKDILVKCIYCLNSSVVVKGINMTKHCEKVHKGTKCSHCKTKLNGKSDWIYHCVEKHRNLLVTCILCDDIVKVKGENIPRHMKRVHD